MLTHRALHASGAGRMDWVVVGPCACSKDFPEMFDDEDDILSCPQCEDIGATIIFSGLTEQEAKERARLLNKGIYKPFNQIRLVK